MKSQLPADALSTASRLYESGDWSAARALLLPLTEGNVSPDEAAIIVLRCDLRLRELNRGLEFVRAWRARGKAVPSSVLYEECKIMSRLGDPGGIIAAISSVDLSGPQQHQFDKLIARAHSKLANGLPIGARAASPAPPTNVVPKDPPPGPARRATPSASVDQLAGPKLIEFALSSKRSSDWIRAVEACKEHPNEIKLIRRLLSILVRNQLYDVAEPLVDHLSLFHRASGNPLIAAQLLESGGRLVSAFELLDDALPSEDVALLRAYAELCERLNIWNHIVSGRAPAKHTAFDDAVYRESATNLVATCCDTDPATPLEGSRLLFAELARRIQTSPRLGPPPESGTIAIVSMHAGFGGAPAKAMRLAEALARHGLNVKLVFDAIRSPRDEASLARLRAANVTLVDCETGELDEAERSLFATVDESLRQLLLLLRTVRPLYKYRSIARMAAQLRALKPEVVHVIGTLDLQICAYFAAKLAGVRAVLLNPGMMRSSAYAKTEQQIFEAEFHRHVIKAIVGSDKQVLLVNNSIVAANDFAEWLQVPNGNLGVLLNGVEMPEAQPKQSEPEIDGTPSPRRQISVIGRLAQEKRPNFTVDILVDVLKQLPSARAVFAGDGPLRASTEAYVASLGYSANIEFKGNITNVPELLKSTDCVLLISDGEGLPNTLIEAQVMGVPVVSSDAGGARETFIDGTTGILIANETKETFVAAIIEVLSNAEFGRKTRAMVPDTRSRFSMHRMASDSIALYHRIRLTVEQ